MEYEVLCVVVNGKQQISVVSESFYAVFDPEVKPVALDSCRFSPSLPLRSLFMRKLFERYTREFRKPPNRSGPITVENALDNL